MQFILRWHILILFLLVLIPLGRAHAAPLPSGRPTVIEVGVQPLGYPAAMIGTVLGHDAILRRELAASGYSLKLVPFRKGNDMVDLIGTSLSAAIVGDMPAIRMAIRSDVCMVGLTKKTFTSVVARNISLLAQLKRKRVGYPEGSSAHHTLLQALASVGLTEQDVRLVPMDIDAMPASIEAGDVDAFVAWEPAPTLTLVKNTEARVLFRGASSDFFLVSGSLVRRDPQAALSLSAALVRALNWLRQSNANLQQAALWAAKDAESLNPRLQKLPQTHVIEITRREILDVPAAPVIVRLSGHPPLKEEFYFLKKLGKIPAGADYQRVERAFAYDGLQQVLKSPQRYRLGEFEYRP
ncbi:ABC transporter substrate-binding protein [Geomonas nitrogeniifigens]|uniref:ABC transporter substrate-binding protein n=1 Tax=Geomonas diazotrophica TaxID=2843197 RepID=A0ABX8JL66_9BACT|nr:ABC transporter substrate-binding protein [Geomonas nitrogeniifigens]QWV97392.1 ABC transporter substrate-binding protein [Geomonas nitrogeniifigens]QXE86550.1 ABC transporter substrate-binding protein [Geomonas nitrogeniifigens]